MKIAFGCDHAGFHVKQELIDFLAKTGHQVVDAGCSSSASCDYPDIARTVAQAVSRGVAERGILLCGTGVGMSIAANKVPGIRAAVCWGDEIASLVSEHNRANILCMGARFATPDQMKKWITIWLTTPGSTQERHVARLRKIEELEKTGGR